MTTDYEIPAALYYAKSHEWASAAGGVATIGITSYAVSQMDKEIVNVDLCEKGKKLAKGESFGVVDSVKAAFDLYTPVSGEVISVNTLAVGSPEIVANAPYTDGWLIKVSMDNADELQELMRAAEYKKMIEDAGE